MNSEFYTQIAVETVYYNLARDWISRFNTSLRRLDALHLAIAFQNNIPLVTADEALGVEVLLLR
ncbi:MAG: hypothetical protein V7L14_24470 [Nostoc sp.]|uniref:hypothetical protein n=1 Tax=Nostoc sp. TaxID=1180 RepID=UPI002FF85680